MKKPEPIKKEMLSRDYQPPKPQKGIRVDGDGGHLTTSATFTTSAKAQGRNSDKRSEQGNYFGSRVQLVTDPGTPETDTGRALKPAPTTLNRCIPYGLMSDRAKALHNQNLKDNKPQVFSLTDRQSKMTWGKGK